MKTPVIALLAALVVLFTSACASSTRIGTRHHHVTFGDEISH